MVGTSYESWGFGEPSSRHSEGRLSLCRSQSLKLWLKHWKLSSRIEPCNDQSWYLFRWVSLLCQESQVPQCRGLKACLLGWILNRLKHLSLGLWEPCWFPMCTFHSCWEILSWTCDWTRMTYPHSAFQSVKLHTALRPFRLNYALALQCSLASRMKAQHHGF